MSILFFIAFNLLLMLSLFAYGVYQFLQVEEKRKGRQLFADCVLDETEFRALIQAERYDEATARLMLAADVDRFTAESALAQLGGEAVPSGKRSMP